MAVKFISSILFVKDIQVSRHFYETFLEQKVALDFGVNVGYESALSLWQSEHARPIIFGADADLSAPLGCRSMELGFEVDDLDALFARLTQAGATFLHPILEQPWAQRVFRVYDPDGYLLEIAEPMTVVIRRLLSEGQSAEEAARRTGFPPEMVVEIARSKA